MKKGRTIASDLRKGNKTLIVIHALKNSNKKDRKFLEKILGNDSASNSEIRKAINVMHKAGSIEYAQSMAHQKIALAKKFLKKAKITNTSKEFFEELSEYVIKRKV